MDIMSGLSALSTAIDITKALKDLEGQFQSSEFKLQISELRSALADAKIALADAREALAEKDREIAALKVVQNSKRPVVSHRGYSFGLDENGDSIGRPFCPVCEQKNGLQIQITRGLGKHDLCPNCQGTYGTGGYPWRLPEEYLPKNKTKDQNPT